MTGEIISWQMLHVRHTNINSSDLIQRFETFSKTPVNYLENLWPIRETFLKMMKVYYKNRSSINTYVTVLTLLNFSTLDVHFLGKFKKSFNTQIVILITIKYRDQNVPFSLITLIIIHSRTIKTRNEHEIRVLFIGLLSFQTSVDFFSGVGTKRLRVHKL